MRLLLFLALAAPAGADEVVMRIAAVVDEQIIVDTDVDDWMAANPRVTDRRAALEQLIDLEIELAEARRLELRVTADEIDRAIASVREQNHFDERALADALASAGLTPARYRRIVEREILQQRLEAIQVRARAAVDDFPRARAAWLKRLHQRTHVEIRD